MNTPESPEQIAIMPIDAVLDFYSRMESESVTVWLDGGWGVEALLGEQTRSHSDLDVVIQASDTAKFIALLKAKGYAEVSGRGDGSSNLVLGNVNGHEIDVHVITLDENGNGIYGPPENNRVYPASSLTGEGSLNGVKLKCISPEDSIKFHSGYELDEDDYHDVKALCKKFNIPLPDEYKRFES